MLISIVGKSGSGKSTVAKTLTTYDERIFHIDVDKISHYVLTLPEVQERIRTDISYDCVLDNEVQRKTLGKIVFASPKEMQKLTDITWKEMERVIDEQIASHQDKIILLDYILLPKTKYFAQSDLRIWVDAPYEVRLDRVIKRAVAAESITPEYFLQRDLSGIDYEERQYDIFIKNINKQETKKEVKKIYEKSIISR